MKVDATGIDDPASALRQRSTKLFYKGSRKDRRFEFPFLPFLASKFLQSVVKSYEQDFEDDRLLNSTGILKSKNFLLDLLMWSISALSLDS